MSATSYNNSCQANSDRMNNALYSRNVPSSKLEPLLSSRPSYPRREILPIVKSTLSVPSPFGKPIPKLPIYSTSSTFNPGSRAPWSGYASNVDTESSLRNQTYKYEKNNDTSAWVPSSNSDLYEAKWKYDVNNEDESNRPKLHSEAVGHVTAPYQHSNIVGGNLFNNSTRTQMKDIPF